MKTLSCRAGALSGMLLLSAGAVETSAQAWNHSAFQPPRIAPREFNIGIAEGGGPGTSLLFQWREPLSPRAAFTLDVGMADPDWADHDTRLLLGGQYAQQLAGTRADQPLDVLVTFGLFGSFGDPYTLVRVPVGVSLGHRFQLDGPLAITPYVHPRASIDYCTRCEPQGGTTRYTTSDTDLSLSFDVGADLEFSPRMALRVSALFNGSDVLQNHNGFGISLAWRPAPAPRR